MTEVSRGPRSRRGDGGSGWILLTTLLVLAIGASSTLVFTNRVELLRLAVVLALWAAVVAAFVTVVYRRQSELDQARARDMKFVYDLQLDREISARREYELSVESHLRRTLSREIRAEAADEMAALRNELVALRAQLEVMLGTDLAPRPALESERVVMSMPAPPGRVESRRVVAQDYRTSVPQESRSDMESRIIDVPEEPLVEPSDSVAAPPPAEPVYHPQDYRGSHRRPVEGVVYEPVPVPAQPAEPVVVNEPVAVPPVVEPPVVEPSPVYVEQPPTYVTAAPEAPWRPPEVRLGRHATSDGQTVQSDPYFPAEPAPEPPRGRHWVSADSAPVPPGRHRPPDEVVAEPVVETVEEEPQGQHAGGQSFAELMARFQVDPPPGGGGGRRRRED